MNHAEADAWVARQERRVQVFGLWLWLAILPVLGLVLYFGYFAPNYHPVQHVYRQPDFCAQMAAQPDQLDAGGQIAPLCGATPYPSDPNPNSGLGADYVAPGG